MIAEVAVPPSQHTPEQQADFKSVFPPGGPDANTQTKQDTVQKPEVTKTNGKDDAKKADVQTKPQKGIDRLKGIEKKPDAEVEQVKETKNDDDAKPLTPEERRRFGELRKIEDEWKTTKPEFEKTKAEYEKLQAKLLKEDERKELESLRNQHAVSNLEKSPDFIKNIQKPIQERISRIAAAAKHANLDKVGTNALLDASDEPDSFLRNKAMRSILSKSELPAEDVEALIQSASSAAGQLHDEWYPKEGEERQKAHEKQLAARNQASEQAKLQKLEQETLHTKAREEVYNTLAEDKFKPLLDDKDLVIDGVHISEAMKNASPAEEPNDRAFEVQMGAAAPYLVEKINSLITKVNELEGGNKKKNGAKPNLSSTLSPEQQREKAMTFEDAFKR